MGGWLHGGLVFQEIPPPPMRSASLTIFRTACHSLHPRHPWQRESGQQNTALYAGSTLVLRDHGRLVPTSNFLPFVFVCIYQLLRAFHMPCPSSPSQINEIIFKYKICRLRTLYYIIYIIYNYILWSVKCVDFVESKIYGFSHHTYFSVLLLLPV
jgi:hypothetical protein